MTKKSDREIELIEQLSHLTGRIVDVAITGKHTDENHIQERDWYQAIPVKKASEIWDVHISTIGRWCDEGKVVAWKPGHERFVSAMSMLIKVGEPVNAMLLLDTLPGLGQAKENT